jgi:hypothetical protein
MPPEDANITPAVVGTVENVVAEDLPVDATMSVPESNPSNEKSGQDSPVDNEKPSSALGGADASASDAERPEEEDVPHTVQRDRYLLNYQIWYVMATVVHLTLIC